MPSYTTEDIRNIVLVGHGGCGKTTLVESLLYHAGAIKHLGRVEDKNTVCDFEPEEQELQHSLNSAIASADFNGCHINLLDTPGYPDFLGQSLSVAPAADTLAVVINAQTGIDSVTRRMMDWGREHKYCRMIIINKIDGDHPPLADLLNQIQDAFGKECLPINLPAGGGTSVVDCFFQTDGDTDFSSVAGLHTALVDQVVEVDEDLMELYLEQGEISPQQLHDPFEKALREGHLVPVCFVSAREGVGVKELLDVFKRLMPNPKEGTAHPFINDDDPGKEMRPELDPDKHVIAHVFKVTYDPFVGKLGMFRIHQGTVTKDTQLLIDDHRKAFKVGHLFKLQGKKHTEIDKGIPGDICAVAKVDDLHFDAILHDSKEEAHIHFQPVGFPKPMAGIAIEVKNRGDEQKLSDALEKLAGEDPCLQLERNTATGETVLRGLGDLHLRIILDKLRNRYSVEVQTHPPSIAYRETITKAAEGHHRHKKQSGGAGQFGEVFLRIEPLEPGKGFEFVNKIVGASIPGQFIPAVEKGVRQALASGAIAACPMDDLRVIVHDGKHHPVDSNEVSFVSAAKKAFLDACSKANPIVLEPIVEIQVTAPDTSMGDIAGDLSSRRGQIKNTESQPNGRLLITGQVPLAELTDYQSRLKSLTGGEGSYTMDFGYYQAVPANVQQELAKRAKSHAGAS